MAEGFDDLELDDFNQRYPEYDNMNDEQLDFEHDLLSKEWKDNTEELTSEKNIDLANRLAYINHIRDKNRVETSFTSNVDGKTVSITNKNSTVEAPAVEYVKLKEDFDDVNPDNFDLSFMQEREIEVRLSKLKDFNKELVENEIKRTKLINEKIKRLTGKTLGNNEVSRRIVNRTYVTDSGSILFKPIGKNGEYIRSKLILKPSRDGKRLVYSKDQLSKNAITQFKELVSKLDKASEEEIEDDEQFETSINDFPLLDTSREYTNINGLTEEENRELEGVLDPNQSIIPESKGR